MRDAIKNFINAYKNCDIFDTEKSVCDLYDWYEIIYTEDALNYKEILFMIEELKNGNANDGSLDDSLAEYLYYHIEKLSIKPYNIFYIKGSSRMMYALKNSFIDDGLEYRMSTSGYENVTMNKENFKNIIKHLAGNNARLSFLDFQLIVSIIFWELEPFESIKEDLKKVFINSVNEYNENDLSFVELEILKEIIDQ